jgi:hypothetical protein
MRFAVDSMLGTLAKWMRILGYDAAYFKGLDDDAKLISAEAEGRIIISRDRSLCSRSRGSLHLTSMSLDEQICAVIAAFPPEESLILTRCILCDQALVPAGPDESRGSVPDAVLDRHDEFWACPGCGRHYWRGTHWAAMEKRARDIIACRSNPR